MTDQQELKAHKDPLVLKEIKELEVAKELLVHMDLKVTRDQMVTKVLQEMQEDTDLRDQLAQQDHADLQEV